MERFVFTYLRGDSKACKEDFQVMLKDGYETTIKKNEGNPTLICLHDNKVIPAMAFLRAFPDRIQSAIDYYENEIIEILKSYGHEIEGLAKFPGTGLCVKKLNGPWFQIKALSDELTIDEGDKIQFALEVLRK